MNEKHTFSEAELRYLRLLSKQYPTIQTASTEIIRLRSILNLPKETEHFMSDIHGEYDAFLHILNSCSGEVKEKLKEIWGDEYEGYAEIYKLDEVLAGKTHGKGQDLTEDIKAYLDKKIPASEDHPELEGCVPVDARLAELLQTLMDKYTFAGVDNSWAKLCYYYQHLGA